MKFEIPELPYGLKALEPYISGRTLEFHLHNHYNGYISNLNKLISKTKYENLDLETIIKIADGPVYDYAAQVWNHAFYFEGLKSGCNKPLKGPISLVIKRNFGSVSFFKNSFIKSAGSLFGAGWIWLVLNQKGSLEIIQKNNSGNPLRVGLIPILACDVWEHAYYLDYQDRRTDYVEAFWTLISWDVVEQRYNNSILL